MLFEVTGFSSVGRVKDTNQDSFLAKVAQTPLGDVAMVAVADGMGGLKKGELASASVMRRFSEWFEMRLPVLLETMGSSVEGFERAVEGQWDGLIQDLNLELLRYGFGQSMNLGTTLTAMLSVGARYSIAHVGDSRAYEIANGSLVQLTEDQTFVKREVDAGRITPKEALTHPRRNVLLQCIGASKEVRPQFVHGSLRKGAIYLLCSDGFRHEVAEHELSSMFSPAALEGLSWDIPDALDLRRLAEEPPDQDAWLARKAQASLPGDDDHLNYSAQLDQCVQSGQPMRAFVSLEGFVAGRLQETIGLVMKRGERDNVTAVLLKVGEEVR